MKDEEHRYPNGKLEKIESFATQRNIPKEILITPTEETTAENALKFLEENLQSKVEKLKGQGLEKKILPLLLKNIQISRILKIPNARQSKSPED